MKTSSFKGLVAGTALLTAQFGAFGATAQEITHPSSVHAGETAMAPFYQAMKEEFEANNPGVTINNIPVPFAQLFEKQYSQLSVGAPPNILTMYDPQLAQYIKGEALLPLNSFLEAAGHDPDEWIKTSRALATVDGDIYAIPQNVNSRAMLVNTKLFREAGVEIPTNIDEFYAAIKALRDVDSQTFGFATYNKPQSAGLLYIEMATILYGFDARLFRDGVAAADEPQMLDALSFYKKIYDEDLIPKGVDHQTYRGMFVDGKVAMYSVGQFMIPNVEKNEETFSNLETILLPFPSNGKSFTLTIFLGVAKDAENPEIAAKYLMQLLEDKWQKRLLNDFKVVPARSNLVTDEFVANNPWFGAFQKASEISPSYSIDGFEEYGPEVSEILKREIEKMIFSGVSPEDTVASLQAALEKFAADNS